jgi:hypothetical protein
VTRATAGAATVARASTNGNPLLPAPRGPGGPGR